MSKFNRRSALFLGAGAVAAASSPVVAQVGCDMLVCVKDRGQHISLPKAGDVVCTRPFFSVWSELEMGGPYYACTKTGRMRQVSEHPNGNHDFFRIVRLFNVNQSRASVLTQPGFTQEVRYSDPLPPTYRSFYLDFSKLTDKHAALREHIADDRRKNPIHACKLSYTELKEIISARREVLV